jgi:insertion element IS1 protein InsB
LRVHHTTIITWLKAVEKLLPDAYTREQIPDVGSSDKVEAFIGSKKTCIWLWKAVDYFCFWHLGDRFRR